MAWADVAAKILFWDSSIGQTWTLTGPPVTDVNSSEQFEILEYLRRIYDGSESARSFLETLAAGSDPIRIGTAANGEVAFGHYNSTGGYIGIDLDKVSQTYYMNDHGAIISDRPELTIIHELQHMYWGALAEDPGFVFGTPLDVAALQQLENTPDYDLNGYPVTFQNIVATEMGWDDNIQSSYASGMWKYTSPVLDLRPYLITSGHSYTNGETVSITRFGDPFGNTNYNDDLDQSIRAVSNDLLMGFGGNDTLNGGGGRDFIYGGDGDDTLIGGSGNDELYGGMETDAGRQDGTDTVRYQSATNGISITISAAAVSVADGEGGSDTLHSIEVIESSFNDDTLTLQTLTTAIANGFDYIDLGGGQDTVDIAGLSGMVTVDLLSANQTVTYNGAVLHLQGVEKVTGQGSEDHILAFAGSGGAVLAGGGDDTIGIAGGNGTIDGGDGHDIADLSIAITGSRVSMADGSVLLRGSGTSTITSIEEVIGSGSTNLMYGDGRGTTLNGGAGLSYIEGSGADVLKSGDGDTYFSVSNGGTVISGAGNDYIEASGSDPVTIKFGVGSGHDMLGSYFLPWDGTSSADDWIEPRRHDTILLEGLTKNDIELVWNYTQQDYYSDVYLGTYPNIYTQVEDEHYRVGDAAIRIKSTGETIYLGQIEYYYSDYKAQYEIYFAHDYSEDYNAVHAQAAYNEANNWGYWGRNWMLATSNDTDDTPNSFDIKIFSFDGVTKLDLFDLFDLKNVTSQALPPETKAAENVLQEIAAGAGSSVVAGTSAADSLTGSAGDDDILAGAGNDSLNGGDGNDFLRGGDGNDIALGGIGNDNLSGGAGSDTLTGGAGNDALAGENGDDTYVYAPGDGDDVIREASSATGGGTDRLQLGAGIAPTDVTVFQTPDGTGLLLSFAGGGSVRLEKAISNPSETIETVQFADGTIWTYGDLVAQSSNHAPVVQNPIGDLAFNEDTLVNFTVPANTFSDSDSDPLQLSLTLANGDPLPSWLSFDGQTITGQPPADFNGSLSLRLSATDGELSAGQTFALTISPVNDAPVASNGSVSVESGHVVSGQISASDVDGEQLAFTIATSAPNGTVSLNAQTGAFTYTPAAGYSGTDSFAVDVSDGHGGVARSTVNVTVTPHIINGTSGNDTLTGTAAADQISGLAGADILYGRDGNDILLGGDGNDTLYGEAGDDQLFGGNGDDIMYGGPGADLFDGGTNGSTLGDAVTYSTAAGPVAMSLTTGQGTLGDAAGDTYINIERFIGSNYADWLEGDAGANFMAGLDGNDTIFGMGGNDTLWGGNGADVIHGGDGNDSFGDDIDGSADLIFGDAGNDYLPGGNYDVLDGGAGDDQFSVRGNYGTYLGGDGNDDINAIIQPSGPQLTLGTTVDGGAGYDRLDVSDKGVIRLSSISNIEWIWAIEQVSGAGKASTIYLDGSTDLSNATFRGYLDLYAGLSTGVSIIGPSGLRYASDAAVSKLRMFGGAGDDTLTASSANDELSGGTGSDILNGGAGNDRITGGAGTDHMTGGTGNDTFVFANGDFGGLTDASADEVVDFTSGQDGIDLSSVDANSGLSGDQAFAFIGSNAFHNVAGELRYEVISGTTYVYGDTNGDGVADFMIKVDGSQAFISNDFLL